MERNKIYDSTILVSRKDAEGLKDAASHLAAGEVVAFPTETVYGLGANALDSVAVDKIFTAKGRPGDNPLIVHISDKAQVDELVAEVTPLAKRLMDEFMPGPITVIMKKSDKIPANVTAGLDTVGIRMPSDKAAQAFLSACACPVAAPSANLSGSPSPTKAVHVMNDMDGYIYAIVDGGDSVYGLESTVVDATGEVPVILRPGAVTKEDIDVALEVDTAYAGTLAAGQTPSAPGMKYRHYAPSAEVEIISTPESADSLVSVDADTDFEEMSDEDKQKLFEVASPYIKRIREILESNPVARIGVFCGREVKVLQALLKDKVFDSHVHFFIYGNAGDVVGAAHNLFAGLRHLDLQGVDYILAAGFLEKGMGKAYMNRLNKAAVKNGEVTGDMPVSEELSRKNTELDSFSDTFVSTVLFVSEENRALSMACETIMTGLMRENAPFCASGELTIGAELYAESAGLYAIDGEKPDARMCKALDEVCGYNASYLRSKKVTVYDYDNADVIIAMRDEQAYEIVNSYPDIADKVFSLSSYAASKGLVFKDDQGRVVSISIPDPKGENYATYQHTVKALGAWLKILFPYIIKDLGAELY